MQQLPTFDVSWSNLLDLWNEISYETGINPSFEKIVVLESTVVEGIEPCQGFDWLPAAKLGDSIKPKKRTINYGYRKYAAHVAHAPKASLQTLHMLLENNIDEEMFASIALLATAKQFLGKLPHHWRGWNYRFLQEIQRSYDGKTDRPSYPSAWHHSTKWIFPEGFYSKGVVDGTSKLNASIFVELSLCNLAYYCDTYCPCYYLQTDIDDAARFEEVMADIGMRTVFQENKGRSGLCEKDTPKQKQIKLIEKEIEDYDKSAHHREGKMVERKSVAYERSPQARSACLQHYGYKCAICGIDFGKEFGKEFSGVIEVHHLEPLSLSKGEREVDPIKDLIPLCPNCHKMIHRKTGKPYTLEEVKAIRGRASHDL